MHPILEQVKATMGDKLRIIKIDVDKQQMLAAQYKIQAVPTLVLFQNGEMLYRHSGAMTKTDIMSLLAPFM